MSRMAAYDPCVPGDLKRALELRGSFLMGGCRVKARVVSERRCIYQLAEETSRSWPFVCLYRKFV
jgi:hypothetical protein